MFDCGKRWRAEAGGGLQGGDGRGEGGGGEAGRPACRGHRAPCEELLQPPSLQLKMFGAALTILYEEPLRMMTATVDPVLHTRLLSVQEPALHLRDDCEPSISAEVPFSFWCNLNGCHLVPAQESRRIDNQLRGRSGRQGDPGSTRFFLSLEDKCVLIAVACNLGPGVSPSAARERSNRLLLC